MGLQTLSPAVSSSPLAGGRLKSIYLFISLYFPLFKPNIINIINIDNHIVTTTTTTTTNNHVIIDLQAFLSVCRRKLTCFQFL